MTQNVTPEVIEAAKTAAGGWSKSTLESWGVPWPPPRGWRRALERDEAPPDRAERFDWLDPANAKLIIPGVEPQTAIVKHTDGHLCVLQQDHGGQDGLMLVLPQHANAFVRAVAAALGEKA